MTPEQKAFYECGKSVESVRETIQKIRQHAIHEFGEPYYLLMPSEKRILRMATDLAGKIHTVRRNGRVPGVGASYATEMFEL